MQGRVAELSASEAGKDVLCFVVDTTASMNNWIVAMRQTLQEVVDTAVLSGCLRAVGVLEYGDFDSVWMKGSAGPLPVRFSGWGYIPPSDPKQEAEAVVRPAFRVPVEQVHAFSGSLHSRGGGRVPEATKSALWTLADVIKDQLTPDAFVHILHLTDAPPHLEGQTGPDPEAALEAEALGPERYPLAAALGALVGASAGRVSYSCVCTKPLVSQAHAMMATLLTGNVVVPPSVEVQDLRATVQAILNTWMGVATDEDKTVLSGKVCDLTRAGQPATADNLPSEELFTDATVLEFKAKKPLQLPGPTAILPRPSLRLALKAAVANIRTGGVFTEALCDTLRRVCANTPMTLCANPALGRLFRAFCKRRHDPRRDECLHLLDLSKRSLQGDELKRFTAWNEASYDERDVINADLRAFVAESGVQGIVRFSGSDEGFAPRSLSNAFIACDKEGQAAIVAVLARMTVDESFVMPPEAAASIEYADDDAATAPPPPWSFPAGAVPLNLPSHQLFSLLLHAAVPGTRLSQRPAAILALLALRSGSVVKQAAAAHLAAVRGRWIDWSFRKSGTESEPNVAENFSLAFLRLILRVKEAALTEAEATQARTMLRVAATMRADALEMDAETYDIASADAQLPDHLLACSCCGEMRPASLVAEDGGCGYCHMGRTVGGVRKYGKTVVRRPDPKNPKRLIEIQTKPAPPAAAETKQLQVRCSGCGGFYARDASAQVMGSAKCFYCSSGLPPSTVDCATCHWKIVSPGLRPLPNGQCGPCATGRAPRRLTTTERVVRGRDVFPRTTCWRAVSAALGLTLRPEAPAGALLASSPAPLATVLSWHDLHAPLLPVTVGAPPAVTNPTLRNVANAEALWKTLITAISTDRMAQLASCALCCEDLPPTQLQLVCGRKGCGQRVCGPCAEHWYKTNRIGGIVAPRSLHCPLCARAPAQRILFTHNPDAVSARLLQQCADPKHDFHANYFAWCTRCSKVDVLQPRECGAVDPADVTSFLCEKCRVPDVHVKFHECPFCTVATVRVSGCAHITCQCGGHWCYLCGKGFADGAATYAHMAEGCKGREDGLDNDLWGEYLANDGADDYDD